MKACEGKLSTSVEDRKKLSQANSQIPKEQAEVRRLEQEGFARVMVTSREASKRVKQLNLATSLLTLKDPCRSLLAVVEFIAKVVADVRVFKSNIITQLANDKNSASKQTAAPVMAAFREANPNAIVPDFPAASPSKSSPRMMSAPTSEQAKKMFLPR